MRFKAIINRICPKYSDTLYIIALNVDKFILVHVKLSGKPLIFKSLKV